jgi:hypothetical protein
MNDHWILLIHEFESGDTIGILEGSQEDLIKVQDKIFEMDKITKQKRDIWFSNKSCDDMKLDTELYVSYVEEQEKVMEYICNCGLLYTPFEEIFKVSLS